MSGLTSEEFSLNVTSSHIHSFGFTQMILRTFLGKFPFGLIFLLKIINGFSFLSLGVQRKMHRNEVFSFPVVTINTDFYPVSFRVLFGRQSVTGKCHFVPDYNLGVLYVAFLYLFFLNRCQKFFFILFYFCFMAQSLGNFWHANVLQRTENFDLFIKQKHQFGPHLNSSISICSAIRLACKQIFTIDMDKPFSLLWSSFL